MELYDAIFYRKSIKEFSHTKLEGELLEIVKQICKDVKPFNSELNIEANFVSRGHMIELVLGKKNKIKAPHYIVITSNDGENNLENVGYIGEEIILKLTTLGIGSCWIENKLKRGNIEEIIDIVDEECEEGQEENLIRPLGLIAVGYPKNPTELFRDKESKVDRKPAKEIIKKPNKILNPIIEAIRLTPSFENQQPWKIYSKNENVMFYEIKPKKKYREVSRISMGSFMKHFEVACNRHNIEFEFSDNKFKNKINKVFIKSIVLK